MNFFIFSDLFYTQSNKTGRQIAFILNLVTQFGIFTSLEATLRPLWSQIRDFIEAAFGQDTAYGIVTRCTAEALPALMRIT